MVIIYSITSLKGIKCYIGSTIQTLNNRKAQHKKKLNCTSKILFDEYGFDNCIFTVLEECTTDQRFERERYYIENTLNIVNIKIPTRTPNEYYNDNKDKINEYRTKWNIDNKDKNYNTKQLYYKNNKSKLLEKSKLYSSVRIICDICLKEMIQGSLLRHKKRHHTTAS